MTRSALRFRRDHRELFAKGRYLPLRTAGEKQKHLVAFARSFGETTVLVLVGRFFAQLGAHNRPPVGREVWRNTEVILRKRLPAARYRDVFTGQTFSPIRRNSDLAFPTSKVFSHLPISLLVSV